MASTIDPRLDRAREYLLAHLDDEGLTWHSYRTALEPYGLESGQLTQVLNDLELDGLATYALDGRIRRPQPGDPGEHPLDTVASDVMALDWTPGRWTGRAHREKGGWSIREAFEELAGRHRHVDVFRAMHEHLKGRELKAHRVTWVRVPDNAPRCLCGCGTAVDGAFVAGHDGRFRGLLQAGIICAGNAATARVPGFAVARTMRERLVPCVTYLERLGHPQLAAQLARDVTPHLPPSVEQELVARAREVAGLPEDAAPRRALERELCDRYAATLPGARVEHRVADGLRVDVLDVRALRVVGAKLDPSVVSVAHAYGQAAAYRMLLNDAPDGGLVAQTVAVLLPTAPTAAARRFLESQSYLEPIELVYLDGDTFSRESFMDGISKRE